MVPIMSVLIFPFLSLSKSSKAIFSSVNARTDFLFFFSKWRMGKLLENSFISYSRDIWSLLSWMSSWKNNRTKKINKLSALGIHFFFLENKINYSDFHSLRSLEPSWITIVRLSLAVLSNYPALAHTHYGACFSSSSWHFSPRSNEHLMTNHAREKVAPGCLAGVWQPAHTLNRLGGLHPLYAYAIPAFLISTEAIDHRQSFGHVTYIKRSSYTSSSSSYPPPRRFERVISTDWFSIDM